MDTQQLMQLERAAVDAMVSYPRTRPLLFLVDLVSWGVAENSFPFFLQSPPYAVSAEKRREAEAIFLDFRKSKLPYEACKYILGQCG